MQQLLDCLWAKSSPFESLLSHMQRVGECAESLLRHSAFGKTVTTQLAENVNLSSEEIITWMAYLAAMHDIGKCNPLFQAKEPKSFAHRELMGLIHGELPLDQVKTFRHEKYTLVVLLRQWKCHIEKNSRLWRGIATALSLHHQGRHGSVSEHIPLSCMPEQWIALQDGLEVAMRSRFAPPLERVTAARHMDALTAYVMGVTILADWIASGETDVRDAEQGFENALYRRGLMAQLLELPTKSFQALWPDLAGFELRGVQECAEKAAMDGAALYLIEAPMGEGKTEAATYLAAAQCERFGKSGFYVALPTAATGNQMCARMDRFLAAHGGSRVQLLHAMAWMVDRMTPEHSVADGDEKDVNAMNQWLMPLRRGLLAQNAVGTIDQAMMAVMPVKYGILRLLGLSGKALILDEIHAYDTYMETIIEQLLKWCRALEIPVVLLSATLPSAKKRTLLHAYGAKEEVTLSDCYPVITEVMLDGIVQERSVARVHMHRKYEIALFPYFNDARAVAGLAIERADSGGCICVMLNTVKQAQRAIS